MASTNKSRVSFLLTRIRRALAEPPQEPMTHCLLVALSAHWKNLFEREHTLSDELRPFIMEAQEKLQVAQEADQNHITCALAAWEAKRAAFYPETTLGGLPGRPGPLDSADWGTHWILFHWRAPETGGPVWGYRIERSGDNRHFYAAEMCIETEATLLHQPQGQKFYYRAVPFNGWGDGPPSAVFGTEFDPELVDEENHREPPQAGDESSETQSDQTED